MNKKQLLQALVNGLDTSNLDQADAEPSGVSAADNAVNALLLNEEAAGPGSVSAFKASVNAIIAQLPD